MEHPELDGFYEYCYHLEVLEAIKLAKLSNEQVLSLLSKVQGLETEIIKLLRNRIQT